MARARTASRPHELRSTHFRLKRSTTVKTLHKRGAFKSNADELAILGGVPSFREELHVGRPNIGNRDRLTARIHDILDRAWLSNDGPYVQEFERRIATTARVRHCVATSSGTTALQIAARVLGMKGEVIMPALTFIATAHALQWIGITPVFADVDPKTYCIDPASVQRLISPRTSGIVGVHLWGRPCAVNPLVKITRRHRLPLLFDSSHAFGCSYSGQRIGGFGNAEVFSFHATKFVNAAEGGAIVTNDDDLADRLRLVRNFGFSGVDEVSCLGINGKMNEVAAAVGLTSLEQMHKFIQINMRNYALYRKELDRMAGIRMMKFDESQSNNYQYIVAEVDESQCGLSRDLLVDILRAEGILARRYFFPGCHRAEPYCGNPSGLKADVPVTEEILERLLVLPTGSAVSRADIQVVCSLIRLALRHADRIRSRTD